MEKPFDKDVLVNKLKERGLPMAEDMVEVVADDVLDWISESCAIHPNAYVKGIGVPAIAILKPIAKEQIDKIDGKEG